MSRFTQLLQGKPTDSSEAASSRLSPLAQRLCDALGSLGEGEGVDPRFAMAANGFAKYLRKSPPDDADIREAMEWVQAMVTMVLTDPTEVPVLTDERMDELDHQDALVDAATEGIAS